MRYLIIFLIFIAAGCEQQDTQDRPSRRERRVDHRRRRDEPDTPIVTPHKVLGDVAEAQKAQVTARAIGMRELAAQYRNGNIKTIYDAHNLFLTNDRVSRKAFDEALQQRMEKALKQASSDDLPSNADVLLDAIAEEFESILK